MIVLCFVDDLIYIGHSVSKIDAMIADLGSEFLLTVEKDITSYLGIEIKMLPDKALLLSQTGLTNWILQTYHMTDCNAKDTPVSSIALGSDLSEPSFQHDFSYPLVVGMLMYLASNS